MSEESTASIETTPSKDERTWAMLCHFSTFIGFIFPFGNIIAPLIIWFSKRKDLPLVADQGREVLNFQISMTIYFIITIVAAISANDGKSYRYPINLRLTK